MRWRDDKSDGAHGARGWQRGVYRGSGYAAFGGRNDHAHFRFAGSDTDITADKTSLTFTPDNWNTSQEVTVSAAEDDDAANGSATIEHAASGGDYADVTISSVTATEADNDTPGVTVEPTTLTVPEGGSAAYTVALDTQPSDNVTISLSFAAGSDPDITTDKTSITFTPDNWNAAQEVTVSAAVDNDVDDDAALLNHSASGGDYSEVTIADVAIEVTDEYGGVDVSGWLARSSRTGADHLLSSVRAPYGAGRSRRLRSGGVRGGPAHRIREFPCAAGYGTLRRFGYLERFAGLHDRLFPNGRRAFEKFVRDVPGPSRCGKSLQEPDAARCALAERFPVCETDVFGKLLRGMGSGFVFPGSAAARRARILPETLCRERSVSITASPAGCTGWRFPAARARGRTG